MKLSQYFCFALGVFVIVNCGGSNSSTPTPPPPTPPPPQQGLQFSEAATERGLSFSSEFSASLTGDLRLFAGGIASGDIDGDGDIDLFITRGDTQGNLLYFNENGSFTENTPTALALPKNGTENYRLSGPVFADMDGDKDLDLFIGGLAGDPSMVFANDGSGGFTNVTAGSGFDTMTSLHTISATLGDYDRDGDLDMAMAHWGTPRDANATGETETLWRNDTAGGVISFTPISAPSGIAAGLNLNLNGVLGVNYDYTFSPNFADINEDGYLDLLSVSDFRGSKIFLNNQDGTFSDITDPNEITDSSGMGSAVGDYDNDGDLDWFVSSIDGNRLYQNISGTHTNVTDTAGVELGGWGWASCFADFDADSHLDIYQTNGWYNNDGSNPDEPYTEDRTRLWMSNGDRTFTDKAQETNVDDDKQGRAIVCADFDNDRDLDVLLLLNDSPQAALLWINNLQNINSVQVDLQGAAPNSHGIGTRIYATTGTTTQMREVNIGSNFTSHNPATQIIGLGSNTSINELRIVWPDGTEDIQNNVNANQDITITHPDY